VFLLQAPVDVCRILTIQHRCGLYNNVKLGLIIPAVLINPLFPPKENLIIEFKNRWSHRINKPFG